MGTISIGKVDSRWGSRWFNNGWGSKFGGGVGKRGFTLVELLVVIAIIGILATLILLQLGGARARARDTQRISHINQLVNAMELHFEDEGFYPDTMGPLGKFFSGGNVPNDPLDNAPFVYTLYTTSFGGAGIDSYQFTAELEKSSNALKNDSDINGSPWGVDGSVDTACTTAPNDCIYDRGIDASL